MRLNGNIKSEASKCRRLLAVKDRGKENYMKKLLSIILSFALILTVFTACGKKKTTASSQTSPTVSASPTVSPSASPSALPDNEAGSANPNAGSTMSPSQAQNRNLDEFAAALKEEYGEDYLPDVTMNTTEIEELTGITSDMYEEIYGERSTMKENPDIFIAVRAKEDKKDEVKKLLEEYKDKMLNDNNFEAVKDRLGETQIMEQDNYVFMFLLGKSEFGEDVENLGDKIKEEINRGVNVLKNMIS